MSRLSKSTEVKASSADLVVIFPFSHESWWPFPLLKSYYCNSRDGKIVHLLVAKRLFGIFMAAIGEGERIKWHSARVLYTSLLHSILWRNKKNVFNKSREFGMYIQSCSIIFIVASDRVAIKKRLHTHKSSRWFSHWRPAMAISKVLLQLVM